MTDHQAPDTSTLDVLLLESGQPESPELKSVLLELQALGSGPAPAPVRRCCRLSSRHPHRGPFRCTAGDGVQSSP